MEMYWKHICQCEEYMKNVYQISCICQHTWVEDNEVLRLQRFSAKQFNVKSQIKCLQHIQYNSLYDSNDLFYKLTKDLLQCRSKRRSVNRDCILIKYLYNIKYK